MISVLIPTHNDERRLVPTLAALVPGVTAGLLRDVILVDGGSSDDTEAIADAAGCQFVRGVSDPGLRLTQAAAQARGTWLLFLHADSILDEGWPREAATFIEMAERRGLVDRMAATFRLSVDGFGLVPRIGEAVAAARVAMFGRPRPEQGLLLSRRHYERLGGHGAGWGCERRLIARVGRRRLHLLRASVLVPPQG